MQLEHPTPPPFSCTSIPSASRTELPAPHDVQAKTPDLAEYVPAGHKMHVDCMPNLPGAHDLHVELELAPMATENVPVTHVVHSCDPGYALKVLFGHGKHNTFGKL